MNRDRIIELSMDRAGVECLENDSFVQGLDVLIQSINDCTLPHEGARALIESMMIDSLSARIKVEHYLAARPSLAARPVQGPVFVMGVPRTGTTFTLNLLDQDPRRRTLLKWEVADPIPPASGATLRTDPRCLAQLAAERQAVAAGKLKTNIHFEWADSATECVFVHRQDFKSAGWDALLPMPTYSEFLLSCDMRPTYAWHRRLLQVLQSEASGRWTLKAPSHALFLEALLEIYPDARLVWTHRDPRVAVASLASLIANVHRRFADAPDLEWIRTFYPRQAAEHVRRAMASKASHPGQFHDLYYDDLMRDPIGEMRRLYKWLGEELTDEASDRMSAWLAANPQGRLGAHSYNLEQFGIEPRHVEQLFADYLDQYWVGA
jgi:hypothetical protein